MKKVKQGRLAQNLICKQCEVRIGTFDHSKAYESLRIDWKLAVLRVDNK